jgi:hypothetical protein
MSDENFLPSNSTSLNNFRINTPVLNTYLFILLVSDEHQALLSDACDGRTQRFQERISFKFI